MKANVTRIGRLRNQTKSRPSQKPVVDSKTTKVASAEPKTGSKQEQVLAMLRRPEGTIIDAVVKATGWQPHSVRGFFAAVVRKRLALNLVSEKRDGLRVYRIINRKSRKPARGRPKKAAQVDRAPKRTGPATQRRKTRR